MIVPITEGIELEITPVKDELINYEGGNAWHSNYSFKKLGKRKLIETVQGINKDNFVSDIDVVKNAFCFIKDNIFYCKHYDTIIFAFDLEKKVVLKLYANCSNTSNNQLWQIWSYFKDKGLIKSKYFSDFIIENKTDAEPTTRGKRNKFSVGGT